MTEARLDDELAVIAQEYNVAQFVSFDKHDPNHARRSRIRGLSPDCELDTAGAIEALLSRAGTVNIRAFRPPHSTGNQFHYGMAYLDDILTVLHGYVSNGYCVIANETIDINDGGVSGVLEGETLEFAPHDTPRSVEKPDVASLPYGLGIAMLQIVYGFEPRLPRRENLRVEFSIHPIRVGYQHSHSVIWDMKAGNFKDIRPIMSWPNSFSRIIGDKTFGLLVAELIGLPVPRTLAMPRALAPFAFGRPTGTAETWLRTSPAECEPGHFSTMLGWSDPYALLAAEDPDNSVAAVLAQEGIDSRFSGATIPTSGMGQYVEGVAGAGPDFMLGRVPPTTLPNDISREVVELAKRAHQILGPVRLEFVHDGNLAWVVQLHLSGDRYNEFTVSPGEPKVGWLEFDPREGLEHLHTLIARAQREDFGVSILRPVGITSHVGDLLRSAHIPARIKEQGTARETYP